MQGNMSQSAHELHFDKSDIIVSKTDKQGIITYGNEIFIRLSGYREQEILGKPHNIIRHPDMPRTIFRMLWNTLAKRQEIFAYVKNLSKDGSFYWVLANVTPSYDTKRRVIGYHSIRRMPEKNALERVKALYADLLKHEKQGGIEAGIQHLNTLLQNKGMSYEQYILSI